MLKSTLIDSAVQMLSESGFQAVDCRGSRSSFDILAKREGDLLLIKTLSNVEGLSRESVSELKQVASLLGGVPLVISQRMKSSELVDGTVYDRYGVSVSNLSTFSKLVNDAPPSVYSTRGNYCVHVNTKRLTEERQRMGLTQDALAKTLKISKQSVYRYEHTGRVSLEVFERLASFFGEGLLEKDFELHRQRPGEGGPSREPSTSFKRMVCREFENIGFRMSLTNAPFDMVASQSERVFSVVSNDWRRLSDKLDVLEHISGVVDGYTVCISERRVESPVSVMSPEELASVKNPKELFKLLSD